MATASNEEREVRAARNQVAFRAGNEKLLELERVVSTYDGYAVVEVPGHGA